MHSKIADSIIDLNYLSSLTPEQIKQLSISQRKQYNKH